MSILRKIIKQTVVVGIVAAAAALASCAQDAEIPPDTTALAAKLAKLEAEVANFKDRQEIHEVYVRYGRGIDLLDEETYRSAFWPDAQINYGTELNTVDDHWNNHMIKGHKERMVAWGHLLTNEAVDIDGDVAHVEVYVTPLWVQKEGGDKGVLVSGRYIDRLDRRNGDWRIAVREFIPHFSMKVDTTNFDMWVEFYKDAKSDCKWGPAGKRGTAYVRPLTRRTDKKAGPPCAE